MRTTALTVLLLTPLSLPAFGSERDCKEITDALDKMRTSPIVLQTDVRPDFPGPIETIYATDAMYVSAGGDWKKMDVTAATRIAQMEELLKQFPVRDCATAGEEKVGDRPTTVFSYVFGSTEQPLDMQLWIGDDGLPYRWKSGPTTSTMQYEDVAIPKI